MAFLHRPTLLRLPHHPFPKHHELVEVHIVIFISIYWILKLLLLQFIDLLRFLSSKLHCLSHSISPVFISSVQLQVIALIQLSTSIFNRFFVLKRTKISSLNIGFVLGTLILLLLFLVIWVLVGNRRICKNLFIALLGTILSFLILFTLHNLIAGTLAHWIGQIGIGFKRRENKIVIWNELDRGNCCQNDSLYLFF